MGTNTTGQTLTNLTNHFCMPTTFTTFAVHPTPHDKQGILILSSAWLSLLCIGSLREFCWWKQPQQTQRMLGFNWFNSRKPKILRSAMCFFVQILGIEHSVLVNVACSANLKRTIQSFSIFRKDPVSAHGSIWLLCWPVYCWKSWEVCHCWGVHFLSESATRTLATRP